MGEIMITRVSVVDRKRWLEMTLILPNDGSANYGLPIVSSRHYHEKSRFRGSSQNLYFVFELQANQV